MLLKAKERSTSSGELMAKSEKKLLERLQKAQKREVEVWHEALDLSHDDYLKKMKPYSAKTRRASRAYRKVKSYKLDDLPDYGDVMPLDEFIDCCKHGTFINYDGYGYYVKDGKQTDIKIHPTDITEGKMAIRKEFDTIIWFNK